MDRDVFPGRIDIFNLCKQEGDIFLDCHHFVAKLVDLLRTQRQNLVAQAFKERMSVFGLPFYPERAFGFYFDDLFYRSHLELLVKTLVLCKAVNEFESNFIFAFFKHHNSQTTFEIFQLNTLILYQL